MAGVLQATEGTIRFRDYDQKIASVRITMDDSADNTTVEAIALALSTYSELALISYTFSQVYGITDHSAANPATSGHAYAEANAAAALVFATSNVLAVGRISVPGPLQSWRTGPNNTIVAPNANAAAIITAGGAHLTTKGGDVLNDFLGGKIDIRKRT